MKVQHFTDFLVWQKAHRLFLDLFLDTEKMPARRAADILASQILRSSGSISANIAEGFNRSTKKFLNSLDIALGETNETENWIYKLRDTALLKPEVAAGRLEQCREVGRMLNGLIRSIPSSNSTRP